MTKKNVIWGLFSIVTVIYFNIERSRAFNNGRTIGKIQGSTETLRAIMSNPNVKIK